MEIRGLGIINIKDLFGISAVRDAKKIELVVELVEWNEDEEYDRLGVEELRHSILDVAVPMLRVPVRPGPQHHLHHRGGGAQPAAQVPGQPLGAGVPGSAQPRAHRGQAGRRRAMRVDEVE